MCCIYCSPLAFQARQKLFLVIEESLEKNTFKTTSVQAIWLLVNGLITER